MAIIFMDGFDKYGGANSVASSVASLLSGEWTTSTTMQITAPLSATGQAMLGASGSALSKTLPSNYSRIIGGIRFSSALTVVSGIQFTDAGTAQFGIQIAASTGTISLRNGSYSSGTLIGSAGSSVSANTTHYLEWDITLGNSSAYNVYLDGTSIISGTTGDTTATANSTVNGIILENAATWDDLYLFDTTGTTNKAPLLTNPRIETTFPASDSSVQFSPAAEILGSSISRTGTTNAPAAGSLVLRKFTPSVNMTINSVGVLPGATSATAKYKGVIYSDSAGSAGSLLSSGTEVVGITSGTMLTLALTTPQALVANTAYWIGFINDTAVALNLTDSNTSGFRAANTYASGAPGTAPAMTSGQSSWVIYGNCSGVATNWNELAQQPPVGLQSYVSDSTSGHEDLYNFGALSVSPGFVYCVGMKGYCERSDSGARTVSLRVKSSGTDSGGSSTGQTPGTSFAWIGSYSELDPQGAGTSAWTGTNLNAATAGMKIDS